MRTPAIALLLCAGTAAQDELEITLRMREFDDETGLGYPSNRFRVAVDNDGK